jgi:hypothetical protein
MTHTPLLHAISTETENISLSMNHLFQYRRTWKQVAIGSNTIRYVAYFLFLLAAAIVHGQTNLNGDAAISGSETRIYKPPYFRDRPIETPFGRYHRTLSTIIGKAWNTAVNSQNPPIPKGTVTILVWLDSNGKVVSTKVLSTGNDQLATVSLTIIMISTLPPVPHNLAPMIRDGKLPVTFTFTVH